MPCGVLRTAQREPAIDAHDIHESIRRLWPWLLAVVTAAAVAGLAYLMWRI